MVEMNDPRLWHCSAWPSLGAVELKEAAMDARENKELMREVFAELDDGNGVPFLEALGEDVSWRIIGTTHWSGSWEGKDSVRTKLLDPLFAQFAHPSRNR